MIIEEEERDVDVDDSEVEPEDGESYERAHLQTQEKDLNNLKRVFKEKEKNIYSKCETTTLCRWCNYMLREKYDMDEKQWGRC